MKNGIINIGNSCFLNSAIQLFYNIRELHKCDIATLNFFNELNTISDNLKTRDIINSIYEKFNYKKGDVEDTNLVIEKIIEDIEKYDKNILNGIISKQQEYITYFDNANLYHHYLFLLSSIISNNKIIYNTDLYKKIVSSIDFIIDNNKNEKLFHEVFSPHDLIFVKNILNTYIKLFKKLISVINITTENIDITKNITDSIEMVIKLEIDKNKKHVLIFSFRDNKRPYISFNDNVKENINKMVHKFTFSSKKNKTNDFSYIIYSNYIKNNTVDIDSIKLLTITDDFGIRFSDIEYGKYLLIGLKNHDNNSFDQSKQLILNNQEYNCKSISYYIPMMNKIGAFGHYINIKINKNIWKIYDDDKIIECENKNMPQKYLATTVLYKISKNKILQ